MQIIKSFIIVYMPNWHIIITRYTFENGSVQWHNKAGYMDSESEFLEKEYQKLINKPSTTTNEQLNKKDVDTIYSALYAKLEFGFIDDNNYKSIKTILDKLNKLIV